MRCAPYRVGIVEGQPLLAGTLTELIAGAPDFEPAGPWARFDEAAAGWSVDPPDVAIVDPSLLGPDPVGLLMRATTGCDVPLLLFSRRYDVDYLHLLLAAGASGVVGTDADGATVLRALRVVVGSERYTPPDARLLLASRLLAGRPPYLQLSAREREVLTFAVEGSSSPEIAERLFLGLATVKTHLRNAYAKLGVHDRASALRELMRIGVVSADDPSALCFGGQSAAAAGGTR